MNYYNKYSFCVLILSGSIVLGHDITTVISHLWLNMRHRFSNEYISKTIKPSYLIATACSASTIALGLYLRKKYVNYKYIKQLSLLTEAEIAYIFACYVKNLCTSKADQSDNLLWQCGGAASIIQHRDLFSPQVVALAQTWLDNCAYIQDLISIENNAPGRFVGTKGTLLSFIKYINTHYTDTSHVHQSKAIMRTLYGSFIPHCKLSFSLNAQMSLALEANL